MRPLLRRSVGMLAVYVTALHAGLYAAVAPFIVSQVVDPFSIICHSEASTPADQTPAQSPLAPTQACDRCNLCGVVTPPLPPDAILADRFEPVRTLQVLRPVNFARHDDIAADPKLARGPPVFA